MSISIPEQSPEFQLEEETPIKERNLVTWLKDEHQLNLFIGIPSVSQGRILDVEALVGGNSKSNKVPFYSINAKGEVSAWIPIKWIVTLDEGRTLEMTERFQVPLKAKSERDLPSAIETAMWTVLAYVELCAKPLIGPQTNPQWEEHIEALSKEKIEVIRSKSFIHSHQYEPKSSKKMKSPALKVDLIQGRIHSKISGEIFGVRLTERRIGVINLAKDVKTLTNGILLKSAPAFQEVLEEANLSKKHKLKKSSGTKDLNYFPVLTVIPKTRTRHVEEITSLTSSDYAETYKRELEEIKKDGFIKKFNSLTKKEKREKAVVYFQNFKDALSSRDIKKITPFFDITQNVFTAFSSFLSKEEKKNLAAQLLFWVGLIPSQNPTFENGVYAGKALEFIRLLKVNITKREELQSIFHEIQNETNFLNGILQNEIGHEFFHLIYDSETKKQIINNLKKQILKKNSEEWIPSLIDNFFKLIDRNQRKTTNDGLKIFLFNTLFDEIEKTQDINKLRNIFFNLTRKISDTNWGKDLLGRRFDLQIEVIKYLACFPEATNLESISSIIQETSNHSKRVQLEAAVFENILYNEKPNSNDPAMLNTIVRMQWSKELFDSRSDLATKAIHFLVEHNQAEHVVSDNLDTLNRLIIQQGSSIIAKKAADDLLTQAYDKSSLNLLYHMEKLEWWVELSKKNRDIQNRFLEIKNRLEEEVEFYINPAWRGDLRDEAENFENILAYHTHQMQTELRSTESFEKMKTLDSYIESILKELTVKSYLQHVHKTVNELVESKKAEWSSKMNNEIKANPRNRQGIIETYKSKAESFRSEKIKAMLSAKTDEIIETKFKRIPHLKTFIEPNKSLIFKAVYAQLEDPFKSEEGLEQISNMLPGMILRAQNNIRKQLLTAWIEAKEKNIQTFTPDLETQYDSFEKSMKNTTVSNYIAESLGDLFLSHFEEFRNFVRNNNYPNRDILTFAMELSRGWLESHMITDGLVAIKDDHSLQQAIEDLIRTKFTPLVFTYSQKDLKDIPEEEIHSLKNEAHLFISKGLKRAWIKNVGLNINQVILGEIRQSAITTIKEVDLSLNILKKISYSEYLKNLNNVTRNGLLRLQHVTSLVNE
jgi:hypothetical protein